MDFELSLWIQTATQFKLCSENLLQELTEEEEIQLFGLYKTVPYFTRINITTQIILAVPGTGAQLMLNASLNFIKKFH